jgi:hypothetical protein
MGFLHLESLRQADKATASAAGRLGRCPSQGLWLWSGVVENVLGQVLDSFSSHMNGLVGRCACRSLAENAQLSALMAREPCATQVSSSPSGTHVICLPVSEGACLSCCALTAFTFCLFQAPDTFPTPALRPIET